MSTYKSWCLDETKKDYVNLNDTFQGMGAMIFDGDALMHHIYKFSKGFELNIEDALPQNKSRSKVKCFLKKFSNSGSDRIIVIFFHNYSHFTVYDAKNEDLKVVKSLSRILEKNSYVVFTDWKNDPKWDDFVCTEHISCMATTLLNWHREPDSQFELIHEVCMHRKIQVCLIEHIKSTNKGMLSFLIQPISPQDANEALLNEADEETPTFNGQSIININPSI